MEKGKALGRGLESLFADNLSDTSSITELRISEIEPNRDQPRKSFDETALNELADSIRQHGLLQPIIVRPTDRGTYSIIAGERRWRACRIAGLARVPALIRDIDDGEAAQLALIENLQREDLNPIEEAEGYRRLMEDFSLTQERVAELVGKSRPAVTNALRLLGLPERVRELLLNGEITAGHARALLSIDDGEQLDEAIALALAGASVREIERLAGKKRTVSRPRASKNNYFAEVELALTESMGRRIKITPSGGDKGILKIEFFSREELADLARRISDER